MKEKRYSFRADTDFSKELDKVLEDINSKRKPNQKRYGVKNIVYDFMKEYTKTQPYGLVFEVDKLKERVIEIDNLIETLTKEKNEVLAEIKVKEDIINNTKLDEFKDKYTLKLEEAKADYLNRLSRFEDNPKIDKEELLKKVVEKHKPVRLQDLKEIL